MKSEIFFFSCEGHKKIFQNLFFSKKFLLKNFYEKNMKNLVKIYVATVNVFRAHSVKNFLEGTFHVGMRFKHRSTAHIRENSLWRAHFLDVEGEKFLTKIRAHMTKKC